MTNADLVLARMEANPSDWSWNRHNLVQDVDCEVDGDVVWHWGEKYPKDAQPVLPADQMGNIDALMAGLVAAGAVKNARAGWMTA